MIACDNDDDPVVPEVPCSTNCEYIYLGHINEKHNAVDRRIEQADLSKYDQIWLGGDLCSETTREESTLDYVDSLFNLSSKNTHWSVGNHDVRNGNTEWITARTGRDLGIITDAISSGALRPGGTIVEGTAGNTGIGLAMVCAAKGYPLVVTMAESLVGVRM